MTTLSDTYFTEEIARRFIIERDFSPTLRFFADREESLTGAVQRRFPTYRRALLKENPDNYGMYFFDPGAPVPFLWFGMGWRVPASPGVMPSWGASLEVNGPGVVSFERGDGGLLSCFQGIAVSDDELKLHRFPGHVELAAWRSFRWLLGVTDQGATLHRYWDGYLELLAGGGAASAIAAFVQACAPGR